MELVVRKNDLLRELQLFQGIVERKNTIPILANVLMEAKADEVQMLATDLEVGLRSRCPASVARSGSLTLPAKKFFEIVRALPDTDVRIEQDNTSVTVAADRFDSKMQTLPREDFPTVPERHGQRDGHAAGQDLPRHGRADAVRDHERGHAVLPERRTARAGTDEHDARGDRRPPAGARDRAAGGRRRRRAS